LPLDKNAPLCNEKIRVAKVPHDSKGGGAGGSRKFANM